MPESDTPSAWQLKYCRTCARELVTGVDIFGTEGKRLRISEKLRTTLSVLVLEEDLLPKRICTSCCISLEEFSQYKETVIDAQEKLRGIVKNLSSTTVPQPTSAAAASAGTGNLACKDCGKRLNGSGLACLEIHQKRDELNDNDAVEGEPIGAHDDHSSVAEEVGNTMENNVMQEPGVRDMLECDFCDQVFPSSSESEYYTHLALTHSGKKYPCSLCSVTYAQKASLKVHFRNHHSSKEKLPARTFICNICTVAFYEKKDLTRHSKTHIKERNYLCYICQKFYKSSKCLAKHSQIHVSTKKFVCPIAQCQKAFNKKSRLAEHSNTHSQASSLGCSFCSKTFNNHPNYLKHLRRMHQSKWVAGERAPPPIKNLESNPPTPPSTESANPIPQPSPILNVSSVWAEGTGSSRQIFHEAGMAGIQNNAGSVNGLSSTDVGNGVHEMVHLHDPNQPLSYKISASDFQDMPMELTKVFQESGPLELCVRTETELTQLIDLTSANPKESHCNGKFDLIDLSNVAPFQQQPMDLINRDSCFNLNSVNNSMDLSLRSSFADQSTNSFIRELLDLSSRSAEGYHQGYHDPLPHHHHSQMELNLSSTKHPHAQPYRSAPPSHTTTTHNFLNVYSDNLF